MRDEPLVSYAQNAEDVVLWRALGHLRHGIYVDVGGFDPDEDSVTRIFYDNGWRGIDVEPVPVLAERFRRRRPGNEVVQAAITDQDVDDVVLHWFADTGLSTLEGQFADRHQEAGVEHERIRVRAQRLDEVLAASDVIGDTIHFLKIDVEGAEDQVLRSTSLERWRPWVLVVEATEPNSATPSHQGWESLVLEAGYTFTLFDGLSRFYVSAEHPELVPALSYPACVLDNYTTARHAALERRLLEIGADVERQQRAERSAQATAVHWRNAAAVYWAESVAKAQASDMEAVQARLEAERLRRQVEQSQRALRRVRTERTRLRERGQRLSRRVAQMSARIERMSGRIAELEQPAPSLARRARRRLTGRAPSTPS